MSKYIIEIPDDVQYVLLNGKADNKYYTAVRTIAELEELNSDYINEHYGELQDEAYQAGLNDAWEAAKKLYLNGACKDLFGEYFNTFIKNHTAQEAIAKLKAYEDKQKDRIEVGDEVRNKDNGLTYIVTLASECGYVLLGSDGNCATSCVTNSFEKTGKHYDIASILEAMRNDR